MLWPKDAGMDPFESHLDELSQGGLLAGVGEWDLPVVSVGGAGRSLSLRWQQLERCGHLPALWDSTRGHQDTLAWITPPSPAATP